MYLNNYILFYTINIVNLLFLWKEFGRKNYVNIELLDVKCECKYKQFRETLATTGG
jgi:hypothetical protein